jgi:hypothetical protein
VEHMAYLRNEREIVEMDYPLGKVWDALGKAVTSLEWKVDESKEEIHQMKVKTKVNFMAYPSTLTIDVIIVSDKTTRVRVLAETPVTTITGIVDFGRTRERIDSLLLALIKQLKPEKTSREKKEKTE